MVGESKTLGLLRLENIDMSSGTSPESSSPRASGHKVQNGRVEKSKNKKEAKAPTYRIGGRTFACEACKKGHRVSKCTHASERPVSMTHDPGRPSGHQKRHCDCPRTCTCTKKNCKCERNCSCTQSMYMLVYVPMKDGEKAIEGEWQIGQEVITDLQGKTLSKEEIKTRNELKQMQQAAKGSASIAGPLKPSPTTSASQSPPTSCCQHKKNIEEQKQSFPEHQEAAQGQRRLQCNCGTGCACAFCLDHPNNQTSHLLAQQQAVYYSNQTYGQQQMNPSWAPLHVGGSCMGTNPSFAISNTPNPSQSQFQMLFPAAGPASQGGYFISYPFTRYSPYVQQAFIQHAHPPVLTQSINAPTPSSYAIETPVQTPALESQPSTASCCKASANPGLCAPPETPSIDPFDFSDYDIGNAVASGWNGSDELTFDQAFNDQLPCFPTDDEWNSADPDPLPDIGATPTPDKVPVVTSAVSPPQPNFTGSPFSMPPSIPPSLAMTPASQFLDQVCCQHGVVHHPANIPHHDLQTGHVLPFYVLPTPMMPCSLNAGEMAHGTASG